MISAQRFDLGDDGVLQGFGVIPGAFLLLPVGTMRPEPAPAKPDTSNQAVGLEKVVAGRISLRRLDRDGVRDRIMYLVSVGVHQEEFFTSKEAFEGLRDQFLVLQTLEDQSFIRQDVETEYNRMINAMVIDVGDLVVAAIRTGLRAGANIDKI